ncbi:MULTISPECIES: M3 family oligoendopeptidase [unclassified Bacillus (in: firmicutes)]|uniref:M3 family oligoendopeptidase n=1 Tax=unclassified Bacillus (in: firmicutes) TaxID=185979 RepID=UPI0008F196B4|nr:MULTISPECIES: M3 family oligoendopeptidase [unclassified Bacillus (in: firmicutes)]SFA95202.1 oligoendopeptidase, pepF/M3 family [Bacillus sp. UNCCL13]SFQ78953.1 oligoendopeptidase, pepF/M3 family [Bacillus sp. cl95]
MIKHTYSEVWELDSIFPGGSESTHFQSHLEESSKTVEAFQQKINEWIPQNENVKTVLLNLIEEFQNSAKKIRQAGAFVSCLQAQNTNDLKANDLRSKVAKLSASLQTALTLFDERLTKIEEEKWISLVQDAEIRELSFVLNERRNAAQEKLSSKEESLINALGVDGYHGWGQLYDLIVASIKIPLEVEGKMEHLSVGQAFNKFSSSDPELRKKVFVEWEKAWADKADYLAKTLNHLAGFRLNVYELRGWENVLKEPLDLNRMEQKTLDTMWQVITNMKQPLVKYLQRKAHLLGLEKLSWADLDAPLGKTESKVSYQEGAEFIMKQFEVFGEEMAEFAKLAFENKWIEAEDRTGKAAGGFHTYFPESSQSRIFMTFSGTPSNVSTLAHELGHGFHTYAMRDLHQLNRNYAMNVAETASTFAEMIVADASLKEAKSKEEKIALLDDKLQRSVALLMNIHARFLFETRFYEKRKEGPVSKEILNDLMLSAQKEAYSHSLSEYHQLFWASKLHFFITGVPFYNFPYTFGFLFSLGIYAKAIEEGTGYEQKYIALLKDTASMTVEELALKHLDVDLTTPEFWGKAMELCMQDVEEFLTLTKED